MATSPSSINPIVVRRWWLMAIIVGGGDGAGGNVTTWRGLWVRVIVTGSLKNLNFDNKNKLTWVTNTCGGVVTRVHRYCGDGSSPFIISRTTNHHTHTNKAFITHKQELSAITAMSRSESTNVPILNTENSYLHKRILDILATKFYIYCVHLVMGE